MHRWLINMAGVQITVCATDARAHELAECVLSAMPVAHVEKSLGVELRLSYAGAQWLLIDGSDNKRYQLEQSGDAIYHLSDRIVFHIANNTDKAHCLHAAAVAKGSSALVVPANSGAGKSSFCTWLVAQGLEYMTDELILLDQSGWLEGVARPIQIKSHGIAAIKHLLVRPELVRHGRLANALPPRSLGASSAREPKKLAAFIFPNYKAGHGFAFNELSSADAGMRLMANHVNARNMEGHGFRAMMAIIKNTRCYALDYGGFETLPADFLGQLTALLAERQ